MLKNKEKDNKIKTKEELRIDNTVRSRKTKKETKWWKIKPVSGDKVFQFKPIFLVSKENRDVETRWIDIKIGRDIYRFNYLDLFMFMYYVGNEEMRRGLARRESKPISRIPYDVSFKLSPEEMKEGFAKRRIELKVDDLTMAIAKDQAKQIVNRHLSKNTLGAFAK